jgi:hypothetical protein
VVVVALEKTAALTAVVTGVPVFVLYELQTL